MLAAATCAKCDKPRTETGGQRILVPRFWTEKELKDAGGSFAIVRSMFEGKTEPGVVQRAPGGWTEQDREQVAKSVVASAQRNEIAWVCQRCMNRVCRVCHEPLVCPPGTDLLGDDGQVSHGPYFGEQLGCINPACENFRKKS